MTQVPSSRQQMSGQPARMAALTVLHAIVQNHLDIDSAIARCDQWAKLDPRDQSFAATLVMHTLRHYGECRQLLRGYLHKPFPPKFSRAYFILSMGMVQLKLLESPAHAVVNTSVELAKKSDCGPISGVINAVLKKVSNTNIVFDQPARNLPQWLYLSWRAAYGEEVFAQMVQQCMQPAPLDISVKENPKQWAEKLGGEVLHRHTIRLPQGMRVESREGYDEGAWWVQDVAASLPVQLLGDVRDKYVLDACAAPGGKTAQLCAAGAEVVAVDRSEKRLKRLQQNMDRLGFTPEIVVADIQKWKPHQSFDAILLDAPCSATGTLRRHPDLLYANEKKDTKPLVVLQCGMLARACEWLKPGGVLVYAVCSLQAEEGWPVITSVIKKRNDIAIERVDTSDLEPNIHVCVDGLGGLRCLPHHLAEQGGMDGFFAVRLRKR